MNDEARVKELRKLFPVVKHWTYLYNGSIHPCPRPVGDAMRSFLKKWQNGGEDAFFSAFDAFSRLREKFARLIHANARNIVITESTTAAINLAAQIIRPRRGQNVVVTDLDFMTNTYPWLVCHPAKVRFVKSRDGKIFMKDLAAQVNQRTAAVGICAVTVGSGFRFDLKEVQAITRRHHVPLLVDAAQALGLVDINATDPPLDFLACTASKWLMGPTGVGFLYVADRHLEATPPSVGWLSAANVSDWDVRRCRLHKDAMRFQGGIPNLVGVVGALAGLELLEQIGRKFIERRVRQLTTYAMEELQKIGVDIWTPRADAERAGIVFFRCPKHAELHAKLKAAKIYCGTFQGGIRIDPNFYNTIEEIEKFLAVVRFHLAENPR
ncbi:MAG: aminotransferase class V-fold PLP-dependent enzyme [Verrucomicrobia bacterium]|nr:aminotransferase class V-fold PLP-dependent enzyme [Verrucomicrobiota bacterium]